MDENLAIRDAAVRHCRLLSLRWGEAIPAAELSRGFLFEGRRLNLVAWGRGIFKPKELTDGPLTLVSSLAPVYEDEHLDGDVMLFDYAPAHSDEWANDGLKRLATLGRPVILLKQVKPKPNPEYMVFAPVVMLGFDEAARKFRLNLAAETSTTNEVPMPAPSVFSKAYAETITKARLHQAHFRKDILTAYKERCCICELGERSLLDAAHIIPDRVPEGMPTVRNGLAMCPTHHRAYDQDVLLVTERYRVEVREERLAHAGSEATRKMLLDYRGKEIFLPREKAFWPDPEFLRRKIELAP